MDFEVLKETIKILFLGTLIGVPFFMFVFIPFVLFCAYVWDLTIGVWFGGLFL